MFATYRSCTMLQSVTAILIQRTSLFFVFPNDALLRSHRCRCGCGDYAHDYRICRRYRWLPDVMCDLPTICGLTACSRSHKGHYSSLLS